MRLLRWVCSREIDKGQYCNTEESDHYLDQAKPTYLGASFHQYNRREYALWGSLTQVATDRQSGGRNAWPGSLRVIVRRRGEISDLRRRNDFRQLARGSKHRSASSRGKTMRRSAISAPLRAACRSRSRWHIRTSVRIGFDLPALRPPFEAYAIEWKVADRVSFVEGDFFRDPLPVADVVVFGRVLHNWDLATKKMLLAKAYQAIQKGGAIIVYDMMIDDDRRTSTAGLLSSLNMLLWTSGGFGYTATDCTSWMRSVGFVKTAVRNLPGGNSMIIGKK